MSAPLAIGDEVLFQYLRPSAPNRLVRGVVVASPWEDPDGVWLDIRDESGIIRTARLDEVAVKRES